MARKVAKWLLEIADETKGEKETKKYFGPDASVLLVINEKRVTVWYRKWFDHTYYKYQVGGFRRSPDLSQDDLIKRLNNIKNGGGRR